jgi:ribosome-associated heat shock protein Hsp15
MINDELVKASREVKEGDKVSYRKDSVTYSLEVLAIPKSRVGAKLVPDLIRDITSEEELEKQSFIQMMHKLSRPRGTGRPTKKERRDLEDFIDGDD